MSQLGKNVNWDVQLATVSGTGKLDETMHPLHPSIDRLKRTRKLNAMNKGSLQDFVATMNNM